MIRLIPMNEINYQTYLSTAITEYAQGHVDAKNWTAESAMELATQQYHELLPDGLNSKDNYFFSIEDEAIQMTVGMLWFAVMEHGGRKGAYVFDVKVDKAFRRHDYGEQAFQELETRVHELGLHTIALHVFGHNLPARAMCEKLGYVTTDVHMSKTI